MDYRKIENALKALKEGKIILVTDDEDRENEGDLICSAEAATTENVNFMATYAKGLICMPMSQAIADRLRLSPMFEHNTDNHETAFTVSIGNSTVSDSVTPTATSRIKNSINPLIMRLFLNFL